VLATEQGLSRMSSKVKGNYMTMLVCLQFDKTGCSIARIHRSRRAKGSEGKASSRSRQHVASSCEWNASIHDNVYVRSYEASFTYTIVDDRRLVQSFGLLKSVMTPGSGLSWRYLTRQIRQHSSHGDLASKVCGSQAPYG